MFLYVITSIFAFIVLIAVLVGIHELGHFASARYFGIRVDEFGFGFPPRLKGWRRGETLYSINLIPLGGFVRLSGENGEIRDDRSFAAKPAWQRCIVLAAGAAMNLLGALALFFLVFTVQPIPQDLPRVGMIQPHSPAAAKLRVGDLITAVNGVDVASQEDVHTLIECSAGKPTVLTLQRNGTSIQRTVVPRLNPPPGQGRVGFQGVLQQSGTDGLSALRQTLDQPGQFIRSIARQFSPPPCTPVGVSGPIGIARVTGEAANAVPTWGLGPVLYLTALISMNLAFVNLLPLPALDGGRLLFVLIGAARRRRIRPEREGLAHALGFMLLMLFVLAVSAHDISQWLSGR